MLNLKYSLCKQARLCFLLNSELEELLAMTTVAGAQYYIFHLKIQFQTILDMEMLTWGVNLSMIQPYPTENFRWITLNCI